MKPRPQATAAAAERRRASGSPRPRAWPTRTAAAEEMPSGTMKVSAARFNATWCEAIAVAPSHPISRAMAEKAPISTSF